MPTRWHRAAREEAVHAVETHRCLPSRLRYGLAHAAFDVRCEFVRLPWRRNFESHVHRGWTRECISETKARFRGPDGAQPFNAPAARRDRDRVLDDVAFTVVVGSARSGARRALVDDGQVVVAERGPTSLTSEMVGRWKRMDIDGYCRYCSVVVSNRLKEALDGADFRRLSFALTVPIEPGFAWS